MVPKAEQMQVKTLLAETVTLLCKNGLKFSKELRIEALIGITIDDDEVVLINLNETLQQNVVAPELASKQKGKVMLVGKSHLHKSKVRQSADSDRSASTASSSCQAAHSASYKDIREPVRKKRKKSGISISHQKAGIKHELIHDNHQDEAAGTTALRSQNDDETDSDGNELKTETFIQDFVGFEDDGDDTCDGGDDVTGSVSVLEGRSDEGQQRRSSVASLGDSSTGSSGKRSANKPPSSSNKVPCSECGKTFCSYRSLHLHQETVHEGHYEVVCPLCGKGLRSDYYLRGHLSSRHNMRKDFQCTVCKRMFAYKHTLRDHMVALHPDDPPE